MKKPLSPRPTAARSLADGALLLVLLCALALFCLNTYLGPFYYDQSLVVSYRPPGAMSPISLLPALGVCVGAGLVSLLVWSLPRLRWLAALVLVLGAGALLWLRPVMYVAFDREFARSRGIHTRVISYLLAALIAVTIVLSIRIMGIVLLISLLTIPVVIANSFSKSFRRIALVAPVVAVAGNVGGLVLSYGLEVPPGAAIIFILTLLLVVARLRAWWLHASRRAGR